MRLIQGNEACAEGAIAAGCRFFAGYPISPSSEIAEAMARMLPRHGGVFLQAEDELASLGAVLGAALGGTKAMTATSGPGFSLMQEHIGYGYLAEIPCVVVDVMRGGPSTGLPTQPSQGDVMQAQWGSHGDRAAVVLAPVGVQEVYDLTIQAFGLSETLRMPVTLLYDEVVGHMREGVDLAIPDPMTLGGRPRSSQPAGPSFRPYKANATGVAELPDFGRGYRFHVTGLMHDERGFPTTDTSVVAALLERLENKAQAAKDLVMPEAYLMDDATLVLVAYGITGRTAKAAVDTLRSRGIRAGLWRPRLLWPAQDEMLRGALQNAEMVVVAEMNRGQWAREVERVAAGSVILRPLLKAGGATITTEEMVGHALDMLEAPDIASPDRVSGRTTELYANISSGSAVALESKVVE
ncbi:MAG: 2-oxoacid:acceptor oxidoreductase subunit alpha [Actinobacteria bacterium]|nr:2-oxoacid:acceptor oxidoreductase subunit alpha [Actinomycetota bacterium]MCL5447280.1 2-oxoacid:acceptor oxidoreductase subunit alpha [Actinomycetota bacterium]